jgi:hypothetical protein
VKIRENNFTGNFYGAYTSGIYDLLISHNDIVENSESGLQLSGDTTAVCDSNYFAMNQRGLSISSYDSLQLRYNSFVGNSTYGIVYEGADSVDARMNYWGHPEGPTVGDSLYPGSRRGDRITENVLYDPFLTEPVLGSSLKPVILSLIPEESELEGGEAGELRGIYFMPGVQVFFGSDTVQQLKRISSEILRFVVPAGDSGYVDVIAANTNGLADTLENGFYYIPEVESPSSVDSDSKLPKQYALYCNYPNPFNPVTTIRFDIVSPLHVEIAVYNLLGQKIAVLVNGQHMPGRYAVTWDAAAFASGVYIYSLKSKEFTRSRKLLLIK